MTVKELQEILSHYDEDFKLDFTYSRPLTEQELVTLKYPYPYDNTPIRYNGCDASYSDKELCLFFRLREDK